METFHRFHQASGRHFWLRAHDRATGKCTRELAQLPRVTSGQECDFDLVAGRSCERESTQFAIAACVWSFSKNLTPDPAGAVSVGVLLGKRESREGGGERGGRGRGGARDTSPGGGAILFGWGRKRRRPARTWDKQGQSRCRVQPQLGRRSPSGSRCDVIMLILVYSRSCAACSMLLSLHASIPGI